MKMPGIPRFPEGPAPEAPSVIRNPHPHVQVAELGRFHSALLERHFIALGSEDRRLRFGGGLHDEAICSYVSGIDFAHDAVLGVIGEELDIVGAAHLARRSDGSAELGLSVSRGHRGRGIGAALLARAHLHARNWGVTELFMHCLAENGPIMHLARKQGMQVAAACGDADASLRLAPADASTHMRALLAQRVALIDYALKSQLAQVLRFTQAFVPRVHSRRRRG